MREGKGTQEGLGGRMSRDGIEGLYNSSGWH